MNELHNTVMYAHFGWQDWFCTLWEFYGWMANGGVYVPKTLLDIRHFNQVDRIVGGVCVLGSNIQTVARNLMVRMKKNN